MASNLIDHSQEILQANALDLEEANRGGLKSSLIARLGLSEKKLQTLSVGLQQIAEKANVLGLLSYILHQRNLHRFRFSRSSRSSNTSG